MPSIIHLIANLEFSIDNLKTVTNTKGNNPSEVQFMLMVAKMQHGSERISNNIRSNHSVDVSPCTSNNHWSHLAEGGSKLYNSQ